MTNDQLLISTYKLQNPNLYHKDTKNTAIE